MRDAVAQVVRWAAGRPDVVAVGLAGSQARGTARPDSDVDLVVVTRDRDGYLGEAGPGAGWAGLRTRRWGPLLERRFRVPGGPAVELGFVPESWAAVPVDPGTAGVVAGGFVVLHDPAGVLARLVAAVPVAAVPVGAVSVGAVSVGVVPVGVVPVGVVSVEVPPSSSGACGVFGSAGSGLGGSGWPAGAPVGLPGSAIGAGATTGSAVPPCSATASAWAALLRGARLAAFSAGAASPAAVLFAVVLRAVVVFAAVPSAAVAFFAGAAFLAAGAFFAAARLRAGAALTTGPSTAASAAAVFSSTTACSSSRVAGGCPPVRGESVVRSVSSGGVIARRPLRCRCVGGRAARVSPRR